MRHAPPPADRRAPSSTLNAKVELDEPCRRVVDDAMALGRGCGRCSTPRFYCGNTLE